MMAELLGARHFGGVAVTDDELRAIQKLYGFVKEPPNKKPDPPEPPRRESFGSEWWKYDEAVRQHERALQYLENWKDPQPLMQAGADKNAMRHAEADGLRVIAWLAKYLQPGEDPLKYVVQMATGLGLDIDPQDLDWADTIDDDEKDE